MLTVLKGWMERFFSDEEALIFLLILISSFAIIISFGRVLAPVFIAIITAYLLQGGMHFCKRKGLGHLVSTIIMFTLFVGCFLSLLLVVIPATISQAGQLFYELPNMLGQGQELLMLLPEKYPELIAEHQVQNWISQSGTEMATFGQWLLSFSIHSIPGAITILIYLVLVPILVFFFLKDGSQITGFFVSFLPSDRKLMNTIWAEMEQQIANYIRGKAVEIFIVGGVTYVGFISFGLNYAELLAILVGLSVLIPYIGAAVVTVPVALIAYFQFGYGETLFYCLLVYGIIQALDGNVLVPLLFSEVVNLHPVAIIVAVLGFGGIWGFWGVFFAIPLATLFKAVLTSWPQAVKKVEPQQSTDEV
ncbi:AI-2E family transporter [Oleispira antarctica]|uniref:AI-2E family transporter n=1 Tax=Oleispira antarctica TaxID=188908 RepID=A0A1Y5HV02_OLEAN|nr:AI-2E family transporter [Oleispira antarctica]